MQIISVLLAAASLACAKPLSSREQTSFSGGDITFYDGGQTACGATINTNSDKTVAVSFSVFDNFPGATANPNANPICKTFVKATINGKTQKLLVQDKCSACKDGDLDLTHAAFNAFGVSESVGRLSGLKWEFVGSGGGDSNDDDDSKPTSTKAAATTKKEVQTSTSSPSSETADAIPTAPVQAVGGAVDSSPSSSDSSDDATDTAAADDSAPTSTTDDSEDTTPSSASEADSTATEASDSSSSSSNSSSSTSQCDTAWDACNAKFHGTAEDVANYSCQTEYVKCVDDVLAQKKRSVSLRRHLAHSRLESF